MATSPRGKSKPPAHSERVRTGLTKAKERGDRARARRHDDRRAGVARRYSAVDVLAVMRAVGGEQGDRAVNPVEQGVAAVA